MNTPKTAGRPSATHRSVLALLVTVLLLTVTVPVGPAQAGHTSPATITVCADGGAGCDFASIQAALDHANAGDTVVVRPGTYQEAPLIDTNAAGDALDGVTLCATTDGGSTCQPNPDEVVITSLAVNHTAVTVRADDVTVQGFTIRSPSGSATAVDASGAARPAIVDNVLEAGIDPDGPFGSAAATLDDEAGAPLTDPFTEEVVRTGALHAVRAQVADEPGLLSVVPVTGEEAEAAAGGPHLGIVFTGPAPDGLLDRVESEHPLRVYEDIQPEKTMRIVERDSITVGTNGPQGPRAPSPVEGIGPGTFLLIDRPDIPEGFVAVCTANFVFEDPGTGTQYLGTAGHCVLPEGIPHSETTAFDDARDGITIEVCEMPLWTTGTALCWTIQDLATGHDVLYARQVANGNEFGNDFAWIEIPDPAPLPVRPWIWQWGGPIGATEPGLAETGVHYGHGVGTGATFLTEGRAAATLGSFSDGHWEALGWATGGDSGSAFATAEPRLDDLLLGRDAVGDVTHSIVVVGAPLMLGTTVDRALTFLNASVGVELSLVLEDGTLLDVGDGGGEVPDQPLPSVDPVERVGVELGGSTDALVRSNSITVFAGEGPGVGVRALAAAGGAPGATVADNAVDAASVGVHLAAGSDGAAVTANAVTKTGPGAGAGIVVRAADATISANTVDASAGRAVGIDVGASARATVEGNVVEVGLDADDGAASPVSTFTDDRTAAYADDPFVQEMLGSAELARIAEARRGDPGFLGAHPVPTPFPHVGLFYEGAAPDGVEEVPPTPDGATVAVRLYERRGAPATLLPDEVPDRSDGPAPAQGPQTPAPPEGIGPGSLVAGGICSANWVWNATDPVTGEERFFLGTAGHCVLPDGAEGGADAFDREFDVCVRGCLFALVGVPGEEWVTLDPVYGINRGVGNDFAIAEVPPEHHDELRPELWFWGGVDEEDRPGLGDVSVQYGWGLGTGDTFLTQGRAGLYSAQPWWDSRGQVNWLGATSFGDSGSAVGIGETHEERGLRGRAAAGIVTHLCGILATIPFNNCGTHTEKARDLVADFTGLDIAVVAEGGLDVEPPEVPPRIGVDLSNSVDATVRDNQVAVAAASDAMAVRAAGDGATIVDNVLRLRGGGCTPEEIADGACFRDGQVHGVLANADGVTVEGNLIAADLVDPDDGSVGGTNGVNAVGAADLVVRGNLLRHWAANAVALFGATPNATVESNAFDTSGTGVLVCAGSDGSAVLDNGFTRHFQAVVACGDPGPADLAVSGNGLGLSNGVGLALGADTSGRVVDAECNDWGAYDAATIATTRVRDEGTGNVVDFDPWVSASTGEPPLGCLVGPTADFGFHPDDPSFNEAVRFDDRSQEGARPIVERTWHLGDGATASGTDATHTYGVPGTFDVTLVVRDMDGRTSSETRTVTVLDRPPVFDPAVPDPTVAEGESLAFNVFADDPEGLDVTLSASGLPDGATFDAASGKFAWTPGFDQAGTHDVTFTVDDGRNQVDDVATVTVLDDPTIPDVEVLPPMHVTQEPDVVVVDETVDLQGLASVDDGVIVSALFELDGAGSTSVEATLVDGDDDLWEAANVSYATTGEKTLVFTAEDDDGNAVSDERTITVVDPEAPVARLAEDVVVVDDADPVVSVDGSTSSDPLGRPMTFRYEFSRGGTLVDVVSFGAALVWKVPSVAWEPPGAGAFNVTLVVGNDLGLSDTASGEVLVDDALGVQAAVTPAAPSSTDAVNVTGTVVDVSGAPVAGADVQATVTHVLTGQSRVVEGSTAADGTFDLALGHDLAGLNLLGEHTVEVVTQVDNELDFEEEPGPREVARTTTSYFVGL